MSIRQRMRNAVSQLTTALCLSATSLTMAQDPNEFLPPGAPAPVVARPVLPVEDHFFPTTPEPVATTPNQISSYCKHGPDCYLGPCCYGILRPGYLYHRWHAHIKPWLHCDHWGYPENFCPLPLGSSLYAHMNAQVGNGQAAQLVLYHFDFHEGASELNTYGLQRLRRMSNMLAQSPLPLIIQRSHDNPKLDRARRIHVVDQIATMSELSIDADRVILSRPTALGMWGVEAEEVYRNMLIQTQNRGLLLQADGGASGTFQPTGSFQPGTTP